MNARNVLLTHFSQRYPKLPEISTAYNNENRDTHPNIAFAFDSMRIRLSTFRELARFYDPLSVLFKQATEMEERKNLDS